MSDEPRGLVPLDQLRQWLAQAASIDEVREVRDQAEAIRLYRKNAGHGQAMQNHAAEIKIRSERRIGELLAEQVQHQGGRPLEKRSQAGTVSPATLKDLGFTKNDSSRYQQMARVPEPEFEQHLAEEKAKEHAELTSAKVLEKAKELERAERRRAREEREAAQRARPREPLSDSVQLEVANAYTLPLEDGVAHLICTSPPYGLDKPYLRPHEEGEFIDFECPECGEFQYPMSEDQWAEVEREGGLPCPGECGKQWIGFTPYRSDPAEGWALFMEDWLGEALRVTKPQGRLALNVPLDTTRGGYRPTYVQAVGAALAAGWRYRTTIVWWDDNARSLGRGSVDSYTAPHFYAPVEMIALFSKGEWGQAARGEGDDTHQAFLERSQAVWHFPGESHAWEGHPAAFPEELPRRLITALTAPGDVVLDPFVGSGTTVLVAHRLGRKAIGYDQSAQYIESAARRMVATL